MRRQSERIQVAATVRAAQKINRMSIVDFPPPQRPMVNAMRDAGRSLAAMVDALGASAEASARAAKWADPAYLRERMDFYHRMLGDVARRS